MSKGYEQGPEPPPPSSPRPRRVTDCHSAGEATAPVRRPFSCVASLEPDFLKDTDSPATP